MQCSSHSVVPASSADLDTTLCTSIQEVRQILIALVTLATMGTSEPEVVAIVSCNELLSDLRLLTLSPSSCSHVSRSVDQSCFVPLITPTTFPRHCTTHVTEVIAASTGYVVASDTQLYHGLASTTSSPAFPVSEVERCLEIWILWTITGVPLVLAEHTCDSLTLLALASIVDDVLWYYESSALLVCAVGFVWGIELNSLGFETVFESSCHEDVDRVHRDILSTASWWEQTIILERLFEKFVDTSATVLVVARQCCYLVV